MKSEAYSLQQFVEINDRFFNDPLIKSFFSMDGNQDLLEATMERGDQSSSEMLDRRFQWFYLKARMIHYTDKLVRLYGKTYDQKKRKYRSELILSLPIQHGEGGSDTVENKLISSDFWLDDKISFTIYDLLPTKAMADTYLSFSSEKKNIIYLTIFHQLNNKEIVGVLDCSPQNVSKMKVKAMNQLKEEKVYG
ncbi:hypothetical protein ACUL41_00220 [Virgibacillus natechei]|uniref:hypothetical protein n=1 Tax=Virgibacillus sp. CBA3643 TaxID=2942278 RepID=UPI0035A2FD88